MMQTKIEQTKLNAISAKILHRKAKDKYERLNTLFLILTLIVPILFICATYISKGTDYEALINIISFILSIILMAASIWTLIIKINDKIATHKMGIRNNVYIANECDNVSKLSQQAQEWFFRYVAEFDNVDIDTFAGITDEERKETYREALKEINPGNHGVKCPICNSSPWNYKKGDCQLCGNTKTE